MVSVVNVQYDMAIPYRNSKPWPHVEEYGRSTVFMLLRVCVLESARACDSDGT